MNRRPFDPRLLRRIPAARRSLAALALLGVVAAALVIAQATALSSLLTSAAGGRLDTIWLAAFVAVVAGRAVLVWAQGAVAARTAATVKAALRTDLLDAVGQRGPGWLSGQRAGHIATLAGRGLDALDGYFTGYLPQLVLSVTVPVAVLVRLAFADWASALVIAVTLPLIPVFGALLGSHAQAATERQWRRLSLLGGHFLDMVTGLPTLHGFGRAQPQIDVVRRMADNHRLATMRTLRIAFLSALVLELVATLSVALVAVPVGLRLLGGGLNLSTALLVLLLAPEAYLPLRAAGSRFHASMEGLTALDEALSVVGENPSAASAPAPPMTSAPAVSAPSRPAVSAPSRPAGHASSRAAGGGGTTPPAGEIRFEAVSVEYERTTALCEVSLAIRPGERIAIIGPSGAGKSTLLGLLLGFVAPTRGRITVGGTDLATIDLDGWRRQLAWVPQRPHLFAASLADNIRLGAPDAPAAALRAAVRAAALDDVVGQLPDGLDTVLGERGHGLSSGQRQRVALARAFLRVETAGSARAAHQRDAIAPIVLLDEPTARLDGAAEAAVLDATRRLVAGRTALLVAHRPALLAEADRIVRVEDGRVTELAPVAAVPS